MLALGGHICGQSSALSESTRAFYRGNYPQAARLAEGHLRKYPNDAAVRVILGRSELAQGNSARSVNFRSNLPAKGCRLRTTHAGMMDPTGSISISGVGSRCDSGKKKISIRDYLPAGGAAGVAGVAGVWAGVEGVEGGTVAAARSAASWDLSAVICC